MDFTINGTLINSEFLFEEGPYIRLYAFIQDPDRDWQVVAPIAYSCKLRDMSVGDSRTSTDGDGPTTVTVVASESITIADRTFACLVGESRRQSDSFLVQKWLWSRGVGWVLLWHNVSGLNYLSSHHVEPGQEESFFPLSVGNWWEFAPSPVTRTSWGAIKRQHGKVSSRSSLRTDSAAPLPAEGRNEMAAGTGSG